MVDPDEPLFKIRNLIHQDQREKEAAEKVKTKKSKATPIKFEEYPHYEITGIGRLLYLGMQGCYLLEGYFNKGVP